MCSLLPLTTAQGPAGGLMSAVILVASEVPALQGACTNPCGLTSNKVAVCPECGAAQCVCANTRQAGN